MKSLQLFSLVLASLLCFSGAKAQQKEWKELNEFHSVMSKSFHPTEEGNFKPLRENAPTLLAKAKTWQASPVPSGYKSEETKNVLARLIAKCEEINEAVKTKKSDADLKPLIVQAHDIFHEIVEKCRKGESEK